MTDRRYFIGPAGAVTDERIERGDLRVLCYLGTFTDKLGWCFLAQGTIASALGCSRATVQRALARLVDAGWVQVKAATVSGRPHACHAYRVIMDRDDPEIGPSEFEVEDQIQDGGCPQVSTPVPSQDGQGCPPMDGHGVPTHARAQKDQDSEKERDGCAREPLISPEAFALADEYRKAIGVGLEDDRFSGLAYTAQLWITRAYDPLVALATGSNLAKTHGHKPLSYHAKAVEQRCEAAKSKPVQPPPESNHAAPAASDWRGRRDAQHAALDKLRAFTEGDGAGGDDRSQGGGEVVRVVPNARHGRS